MKTAEFLNRITRLRLADALLEQGGEFSLAADCRLRADELILTQRGAARIDGQFLRNLRGQSARLSALVAELCLTASPARSPGRATGGNARSTLFGLRRSSPNRKSSIVNRK